MVLHILSPVWKLLTQNKNGTGQTIIFESSITKGTNTRELRDNVDVDTNRGETIAIMKDKIIKLDLSSYKNIFLQLGRNNAGKDSPTKIYKEYSEILKDIITEDPNKHIIVCAVPPRQHVDVSQVNTCLKKLSIDFDLEFLDNYNAFISKTNKTISGSFHHDSIHLSKNGTKILLENTTVSYQLSNNQNLIATSIDKLQRDNILIVSTNMEDIVNTVEKWTTWNLGVVMISQSDAMFANI